MRHLKRFLLLAMLPGTLAAQESTRTRSGFWLEVGGGVARVRTTCATCLANIRYGTSGSIAVGGRVSRHVLLGFEQRTILDESFGFPDASRSIRADARSFLGIATYYPGRHRFFVKGGLGVAGGTFSLASETADSVEAHGYGIGVTFGVGYDLPVSRRIALTFNLATHIMAVGDIALGSTIADDVIPTMQHFGLSLTFR